MPGPELDDKILDFKLLLKCDETQNTLLSFGRGCGRDMNHWGPVVNYGDRPLNSSQ